MYSITLQTNDQSVSSGEIIGRLQFAASSESDGGASQSIVGGLYGVAQSNFSSSANPNSLYFITSDNDSSPAFPRLEISYQGDFLPISGSYNQYDIGASNNRFDNIYSSGIDTYSMLLSSYVPSNTTNKLYNDNGTLKFNGSAIGALSGQLGGNLDLNNYDIVGTGNITIDGNVTAEYFYGDLDGVVITECRNDTGSTISEGAPVYVAGYYSSNGKPLIAPADCANASKMPAIGLLASELTTGSEGHVHVFGLAQNLPSAVTNGFSVGNTVYVDNGGGLTNVRPTGVSELVQNIGRVLKTGTNGRILVLGPGRSNDVPNSGHFEQLTVDGYTALAVDTGNVGIGTASPALTGNDKGLHIHATNYPEIKLTNDTTGSTSDDGSIIQVVNSEFRFTNREDGKNISFYAFDTGGTSRQKLLLSESLITVNGAGVNTDFQVKGENDDYLIYTDANNDKVGIGTASPDVKLHIEGTAPHLRQENTLASSTISHYLFSDGANLGGLVGYGTSYAGGSIFGVGASGVGLFSNSGADLAVGTFGGTGNIRLGTNSTERVRIDGFGNVGIGTDSPLSKLHVRDTTDSDCQITVDNGTARAKLQTLSNIGYAGTITDHDFILRSNNVDGIKLSNSAANNIVVVNPDASNQDFRVRGTTETNLIYVDAGANNVGIGIGVPTQRLHVYELNNAQVLVDDGTVKTKVQSLAGQSKGIVGTNTNHDLEFRTNNNGKMIIKAGGDVGIGTASPSYKLDVNGTFSANSINVNDQFTFPTTDGSAGQSLVTDGAGNVAWSGVSGGGGSTSLGTLSVTSSQSLFNMTDSYSSGGLAVFLNGVKLVEGTDFSETSSTSFTLTSPAASGDIVEYVAYGSTIASTNLQKTGDTMTGNLTVNADLIVKGYKETHVDNGNTGTSQTIAITNSTLQTYTLNGNCTFTMPTADAGRSFTIFLKTGTGSFTATFTGVKWPAGSAPTITTTASRMDILTFYSDGTNWYGNIVQEYTP